jgi:phosphoglycolate phosphatase
VSQFVVGFDLDMTLVDSRPGILATLNALQTESGAPVAGEGMLDALLRRNLDLEMADRFPEVEARHLSDRFRNLYADIGVPGTELLPGATEAVTSVRDRGGRVVVVTAKYEPNALRCLDHVGLHVGRAIDAVDGWRYGSGKTSALVDHGVAAYAGDTPGDVRAALAAGVHMVGVATGPHPAHELHAAGASDVLSTLEEFPGWLDGWLAARG